MHFEHIRPAAADHHLLGAYIVNGWFAAVLRRFWTERQLALAAARPPYIVNGWFAAVSRRFWTER
jgi:hypothetical protein